MPLVFPGVNAYFLIRTLGGFLPGRQMWQLRGVIKLVNIEDCAVCLVVKELIVLKSHSC